MGATVVGLVPAAGYGTRLHPLTGAKELIEVGGRPVIDYLLDRLRLADCREVRVVARSEKRDLIEYVVGRGCVVVTGRPQSLAESLALGALGLEDETITAFGLPDTIWHPMDAFARLLPLLGSETDVVLGLFRSREPERSDVVELVGTRVRSIAVKPAEPLGPLIWGCGVARASALQLLQGEADPGFYFDALARMGRVAGVGFDDEMLDIGTPAGLALARSVAGERPLAGERL